MKEKITPTPAMIARANHDAKMVMDFGQFLGLHFFGVDSIAKTPKEEKIREDLTRAIAEKMAEELALAAAKKAKEDQGNGHK